jgi:hypothetical protein
MTIEHPDECLKRLLQTIYDVLAITNAAIGDAARPRAGMPSSAFRQIRS